MPIPRYALLVFGGYMPRKIKYVIGYVKDEDKTYKTIKYQYQSKPQPLSNQHLKNLKSGLTFEIKNIRA